MIRLLLTTIIFISLIGFGYFKLAGFKWLDTNSLLEARIKVLEDIIATMRSDLTDLKAIQSAAPKPEISDHEARIAVLEKAVASLKSQQNQRGISTRPPIYIPLGSGSTSSDQTWASISTYQIDLNTSDYPGMTSVVLEVNMRVYRTSGTAYARFYNATDNKVVSSEVSTNSDHFGWFSTSGFSLTSGTKTYKVQLKSSDGTEIAIQNARLKINF